MHLSKHSKRINDQLFPHRSVLQKLQRSLCIKPILAKREFVNKMSFIIAYVSQIHDLIKENAVFFSTSSIENLNFNFAKPLDPAASQDLSRP